MNNKLLSTDYWHACIFQNLRLNEIEGPMLAALKREVPEMCSVAFERACNLQCRHCIYPADRSSEPVSRAAHLPDLVLRAVAQLAGPTPRLLHEGRIIRPWHIDAMAAARRARRGLKVGLIDNGTYVHLLDKFADAGLKLDWLDISIDGPERIHNAQRKNASAYRAAMDGLHRAREVTVKGGRVSSLFTLTTINHDSLAETTDSLFDGGLIDELHVTTISPVRQELEILEQCDLEVFWRQAVRVFERHGRGAHGRQRIFFRFYRLEEIAKLSRLLGGQAIRHAFTEGVRFASGEIYADLGGVPIVYAPLSLWPSETFLIDADGAYRSAYSIGHSLTDLRRGKDRNGVDLNGYNIAQLVCDFDLKKMYERCIDKWWNFRGRESFIKECALLQSL